MKSPTISACIIAKNEERSIGRMLASLDGAVDEKIVLDTGSTDRTADVATRMGAKVIKWAWRDDFAAARNESIAHAHGDWALIIDCDHVLAPGSAEAIRKASRNTKIDAANVWIHDSAVPRCPVSEVLSGKKAVAAPYSWTAMFRRIDGPWFERRIHEDAKSWMEKHGTVGILMKAHYVHFGAVDEVRRTVGKDSRNVTLLKRCIEDDATDPVPYSYLIHEYLGRNEVTLAANIADVGAELMADKRANGVHRLRFAVGYAQLAIALGHPDLAISHLNTVLEKEGDHVDLRFFKALAFKAMAKLPEAGFEVEEGAAMIRDGVRFFQRFVPQPALEKLRNELVSWIPKRASTDDYHARFMGNVNVIQVAA